MTPTTAAGRALLATDFGVEDEVHVTVEEILAIEAEARAEGAAAERRAIVDLVDEPDETGHHDPSIRTPFQERQRILGAIHARAILAESTDRGEA